MSASSHKKTFRIYLLISAFLALFSAIYLHFSHGVSSPFMQFLCLIPLLLGALPALLLYRLGYTLRPSVLVFYRCAVFTLTVGSAVRGVMDIYGTTSALLSIYPALALLLFCLSALAFIRCAA